MDNITPLVHGTKSTCNITLNEYQHAYTYKAASISARLTAVFYSI